MIFLETFSENMDKCLVVVIDRHVRQLYLETL